MVRFSIRKKLLFFAIVIAMVPLGIAGRTMIRITQDELKSSANNVIGGTATQVAQELKNRYEDTWLAPLLLIRNAIDNNRLGIEEKISILTLGIEEIVDVVALQITVSGGPAPILATKADFAERLRLAGADPKAILQYQADENINFNDKDKVYTDELIQISETNDWLTTIILPLTTNLRGRPAVFSARIDLRRLREWIEGHPFNKSGSIALVDAQGKKIFDPARTNLSHYQIFKKAKVLIASGSRAIGVEPIQRPDGQQMLGAYSVADPFMWAIIVEKSAADAYLAVEKMRNNLLLWTLAGLTIAIGGAAIFAMRISRPILEIDSVAQQVSQGNLNVKVEGVNSKDEIGDLATRMNEMIRGLVERFQLQKFVSGQTIDAIKGADEKGIKLGGDRKLVTVFFSDIRGFTAFSEKSEPEEVVEMLNTYLRCQAEIVTRHHGDIDKFVGDELVAVFQGQEMVLNAVRCAVEIQKKLAELNKDNPWEIDVGVGINTGEVVMGAMGSEQRMDYTILGDPVNLGARLCGYAAAGQILISKASHKDIAGLNNVKVAKLDPIVVKGKADPVQVYEVTDVYDDIASIADVRVPESEDELT